MPTAISHDRTLCLNSSNDPSIPAEGLELVANKAIPVSAAQATYLKTLQGVDVQDDPTPKKGKE